ncbi:MAG: hypothetical protein ACR2G3_10180 [Solirubrobacterales bacterium]
MRSGASLLALAVLAALALMGTYLALGGSDYQPTPVADPCEPREWRSPDGVEESAEQFALSALDGAACRLQVTRETLTVALASEESRREFAAAYGIDDPRLEEAIQAGLVRAVDDAEAAGALSPFVAAPLRAFARNIPVEDGIAVIEDASVVFEDVGSLLEQGEGLLSEAGDLLDEILP